MADVIANERGYFGGQVREAGDRFPVPDEIMMDEKKRPKWVRLAAFGGKGDHDGNGATGGAAPKQEVSTGKGRGRKRAEAMEASTTEPFADNADPVTVTEALGGPAPDWLPPGTPHTADATNE